MSIETLSDSSLCHSLESHKAEELKKSLHVFLDDKDGEEFIPSRKMLRQYINLKLQASGFQPIDIQPEAGEVNITEVAAGLLDSIRAASMVLTGYQPPIVQRIQSFIDSHLGSCGLERSGRLPTETLVMDRGGMAQELSLPFDGDKAVSEHMTTYRVPQGALFNPSEDRRTTKNTFHVAEGGLPVPYDKVSIPKVTFAHLLREALNPPADTMELPYTSNLEEDKRVRSWVSLLLKPLIRPGVNGRFSEQRMEDYILAPGSFVSSINFLEHVFGNGGDPMLPENDLALDALHWTGTTGCIIIAPHIRKLTKKSVGLPHISIASAQQKLSGMCWETEDELYFDGSPFKVACRHEGVIITLIASSYFGYQKKTVKSHMSYASNIAGLVEEEHAGGCIASPAYNWARMFKPDSKVPGRDIPFSHTRKHLASRIVVDEENGCASDKNFSSILYVPETLQISVADRAVWWTHPEDPEREVRLPIKVNLWYVMPGGYRVRLIRHSRSKQWMLEGVFPRTVVCHKPATVSGGGKALLNGTLVPTVNRGLVPIEELVPGEDMVISGTDGSAVAVVAIRRFENRPLVNVTTCDGHTVICDEEHQWFTTKTTDVSKTPSVYGDNKCYTVDTARELVHHQSVEHSVSPKTRVVVADPYPEAEDLLVDPYVMGLWLGDGHAPAGEGSTTVDEQDTPFVGDELTRLGYEWVTLADGSFGVRGITVLLRELGVLKPTDHDDSEGQARNWKRIPERFFRASYKQRLALLQGMVDSDGHVDCDGGKIEYCSVYKDLAEDFVRLATSLGVKCSSYESVEGSVDGRWRCSFYLQDAARIPRKAKFTRNASSSLERVMTFTSMEERGNTTCIEVDDPNGLFLCGPEHIVTHNSEVSKSVMDAITSGPVHVSDLPSVIAAVQAIVDRDYFPRFKIDRHPEHHHEARAFLSHKRSLGSVIKLLTPSEDFTPEYNEWLASLSSEVRSFSFLLKARYKPSWNGEWQHKFSVDILNAVPGHTLLFEGRPVRASFMRIGVRDDGSWRRFRLRQDYFPSHKLQLEDDISASITVPDIDGRFAGKMVSNCEYFFFQRPDDCVKPGYDVKAEADLADQTGQTFICNYEPLTREDSRKLAADEITLEKYTEPVRRLILSHAAGEGPEFLVCSSIPRVLNHKTGQSTKNVRYLQRRPEWDEPVRSEKYLLEICQRLCRSMPEGTPVELPVDIVIPGRRLNPKSGDIRPLAVFNPIHYQELPELFCDLICCLTGKSPSTTGAGVEGCLTKGPFHSISGIPDLNNALLSLILTDDPLFTTAAGYVGHKLRVDHDISLIAPEIFCRMDVDERRPEYLLENGFFERIEDFEYEGRTIPASRLGYRITKKFVNHFFARVFDHVEGLLSEEHLKPELQSLPNYVEGIEHITEFQAKIAKKYVDDGSFMDAIPPLRAIMFILAEGSYEGMTLASPELRKMFTREYVLGSHWYQARLVVKQRRDAKHLQKGVRYLHDWLQQPGRAGVSMRRGMDLQKRLRTIEQVQSEVTSREYLSTLSGSIGADPMGLGLQ